MYGQPVSAPAAAGSGSGGMMIAAVALVALVSCGAGVYFSVGINPASTPTPAPTLQQQLLALQQQALAPTFAPSTPVPLCPNNDAPVVDINGKVYKNACYAQSVGAQFAPTPFTSTPGPVSTTLTPAGATVNPAVAALLASMPSAAGAGTALNRSAPVLVQRGGTQNIHGGQVSQGGKRYNVRVSSTKKPGA